MRTNPYKKRGSFQHLVAERYLDGMTEAQVVSYLEPIVTAQDDSRCIFKGHGPHGFGPLPLDRQMSVMRRSVKRVFDDMRARGIAPEPRKRDDLDPANRQGDKGSNPDLEEMDSKGSGDGESDGEGSDGDTDSDSDSEGSESGEGDGSEGGGEGEGEAQDDSPPPPPSAKDDDWRTFVREVKRLHKFCQDRADTGEWIDDFGMRPLIDGARLYRQGIGARALLHAMTIHWPADTREEAGIAPFDPLTLSEPYKGPNGEPLHPLAGYAVKVARARIPMMFVGPKGSGKSHLARDVATILGLPYGETPMTAGASPSWLIGGETMSGFKSRPFLDIYEGGGVFAFEEVDASDPNMTIVVNNALASDRFYNPANGRMYEKSADFCAVATANTFGLGATRDYTGRERLDGAFLDRFRMGRIEVGIDFKLAETVSAGIIDAPHPTEQDNREAIAALYEQIAALEGGK